MKLLLDSANLDEIKRIARTDAISGVTTNPSLMAKEEKGDYHDKLSSIANVLNYNKNSRKHLSVEVITLDPTEMIAQAMKIEVLLNKYSFIDLYIKIPVTLDNLKVITILEEMKIKVNATACMNSSQAKMALDAGASIVSYFYNRMKDGGEDDPKRHIMQTKSYRSYYKGQKIICGSIRKIEDVVECWGAGSHYVTASMKIIEQMISHEQTSKAITQFQEDIEKWLK